MGNLSMFKPFKGKDYRFIDRIIRQQFQIGGTIALIHRYKGPHYQGNTGDATQPIENNLDELTIQDVLFVENRDRRYDKDLIELKGHYSINDLEFNLSQFGLMLAGDTLFINFHLNEMVERLGRKLMAGDVIELIHRRDDLLLDESKPAINSFYVIKDASRPAEGYSSTWYPHMWRVKAEPLKDSQEYKDILDRENDEGQKLRDLISTYGKTIEFNDAILDQTNKEVDRDNYDSSHFYIKSDGPLPTSNLLPWVFNGDGVPPNQNDVVPSGRRFPSSPTNGDYFLRTDYNPARLFRRDDTKWQAIEDNWRQTYQSAHKVYADYLEDQTTTSLSNLPEDNFNERQPLSKVILPKAKIPPENEVTKIIDDTNEDE